MRIVSLFANIGVAEARLNEVNGLAVVVANEWQQRRADLYHRIYPETDMICGDITDEAIYQKILSACKKRKSRYGNGNSSMPRYEYCWTKDKV